MTRKLASARRIKSIEPIEGADKIVKAIVDGWSVVTAKDNGFMANDLVAFFEIDSFLPVEERYEFLRKSSFKSTTNLGDGFRLKTIKLRGTLSQGLLMPLQRGPNIKGIPAMFVIGVDGEQHFVEEGDDLTDILGVKLYEKPIPPQLAGQVKGNFPSFLRKTDQERIQNYIKDVCADLNAKWEVTLKLDGSSMTVYNRAGDIGVCSRNLDLKESPENTFWQVALRLRLGEMLKWLGRNYAFQGELMGPGVQGNREWLKEHTFFLYDIWDIDQHRYLGSQERQALVSAINNSGFELPHAYIFGEKQLKEFGRDVDTVLNGLLEYAKGQSIYNDIREGLVFKKIDGTSSFKVINNDYLLSQKD